MVVFSNFFGGPFFGGGFFGSGVDSKSGGDDVPLRIEIWEGRETPKRVAQTIEQEVKAQNAPEPVLKAAPANPIPRIDIAALEKTLGTLDAISRTLAEEQIRRANDEDDDFIMLLH